MVSGQPGSLESPASPKRHDIADQRLGLGCQVELPKHCSPGDAVVRDFSIRQLARRRPIVECRGVRRPPDSAEEDYPAGRLFGLGLGGILAPTRGGVGRRLR
jgi:hypothetical protein